MKTSSILLTTVAATASIGVADGRYMKHANTNIFHFQRIPAFAVHGGKNNGTWNIYRSREKGTFKHKFYSSQSNDENTLNKIPPIEYNMRQDAHAIVSSSIQAVDPAVAIRTHLSAQLIDSDTSSAHALQVQNTSGSKTTTLYKESDYDNIVIVAFGKASSAMTEATCKIVSEAFPNKPIEGITIIKDDHASAEQINNLQQKYNIQTYTGSHPVPDSRSTQAAQKVLDLIEATTQKPSQAERTLLITLISGGGSALFCSPRPPLTLDDLSTTNSILLGSGMNIQQMNKIRKRLEKGTKGGQLATLAYPCTILTCVLSDVIGDPLDLIASGPTIPDDYDDTNKEESFSSSWQGVWNLVEEFNLQDSLPIPVINLLMKGKNGELEDTPKSSHPTFANCETVLVGNNEAAVMAAAKKAEELGYHPIVLGTCIEGEAQHVANVYIAMAQHLQTQRQQQTQQQKMYTMAPLPAAIIAGGETTVTLPPNNAGKGGRNQEIGLAAALTMQKMKMNKVVLASVGTDGTDGPTDAAGAMVDGGTIDRVESSQEQSHQKESNNYKGKSLTLSGMEALKNHDAYSFFNSEENCSDDQISLSLLKTGPTGTNVADVCVVLIK